MPLGFRYCHARIGEHEHLPGLLDSVRWKQNRVASVFQRTCQGDLREQGWQTCKLDEEGAPEPLNKHIEQLCQSFAFDLPDPDVRPPAIPHQFDLRHDRIADQLLENTVPRSREIGRVENLLRNTPSQRVLLRGTSGSGKSVLLSQVFRSHRTSAVFVSMDVRLDPPAGPEIPPRPPFTKGGRSLLTHFSLPLFQRGTEGDFP
ncbi:MAG: hypothetical protein B6245_18300, partial [Desulfobacteraceae bacterium 4572_88]